MILETVGNCKTSKEFYEISFMLQDQAINYTLSSSMEKSQFSVLFSLSYIKQKCLQKNY